MRPKVIVLGSTNAAPSVTGEPLDVHRSVDPKQAILVCFQVYSLLKSRRQLLAAAITLPSNIAQTHKPGMRERLPSLVSLSSHY